MNQDLLKPRGFTPAQLIKVFASKTIVTQKIVEVKGGTNKKTFKLQ